MKIFSIFGPQMRAAAFFISLLFLLTGLNNCVTATSFPHQQQHAAQKNNSSNFSDWQNNTAFCLSTAPRIATLLVCEEVENEENDFFNRKLRMLANIVLSVFDPSFAASQIYFEKPRPHFWAQTSCKYILQRTLRI